MLEVPGPMRATLIHNPKAGDGAAPDREALLAMLGTAGYDIRYQSSKEKGWATALGQPTELVVIAGGDGTVARVVKAVLGRSAPLALLPVGTANNVATGLGSARVPFEQQIFGWKTAPRVRFDVGMARAPWGFDYFIEGLGAGLLAWAIPLPENAMSSVGDRRTERIARGQRLLRERLRQCRPEPVEATLDGRDISGDYLLFEAMNIPLVGPNLCLAPDAESSDGLLDITVIDEARRAALDDYLAAGAAGRFEKLDVPRYRGRTLRIDWGGLGLHLDDRVWPDGREATPSPALVELEIVDSLEFLVPADS